MPNSVIVDVVLALFFTYLYLSLACSALNEWLAAILQRRGKFLHSTIEQITGEQIATKIYDHPLFKALMPDAKSRKPAYIPETTFVQVLLDILGREAADPPGPLTLARIRAKVSASSPGEPGFRTRDIFLALIADLPDEGQSSIGGGPAPGAFAGIGLPVPAVPSVLDIAKKRLEQWYKDALDRASGAYKRGVQAYIILWAVGICTLLNADTLRIAMTLYDPVRAPNRVKIADAVTTLAKADAGTTGDLPKEIASSVLKQANELPLPLGWTRKEWAETCGCPIRCFVKILGLLITVVAVGQGAPFWFDLLGRIVNLRLSGPKPGEGAKQPGGSALAKS